MSAILPRPTRRFEKELGNEGKTAKKNVACGSMSGGNAAGKRRDRQAQGPSPPPPRGDERVNLLRGAGVCLPPRPSVPCRPRPPLFSVRQ